MQSNDAPPKQAAPFSCNKKGAAVRRLPFRLFLQPNCALSAAFCVSRSFVLQFVKFVSADHLAVIIHYLSVIPQISVSGFCRYGVQNLDQGGANAPPFAMPKSLCTCQQKLDTKIPKIVMKT